MDLSQLFGVLAKVGAVLAPMLSGAGLGLGSRFSFSKPVRQSTARVLEGAALKGLLPFFAIESILKSTAGYQYLFAFCAGAALPLLTMVAFFALQRAFGATGSFTKNWNELRFLGSTFGGGNRGSAFLLLILVGSSQVEFFLSWFVIVDLGNFLCQLLVIYVLMNRHYGTTNAPTPIWRIVWDSYALMTALIVAGFFAIRELFPGIEEFLSRTIQERKFVFSLLVFWALVLRFERGALSGFVLDVFWLAAARLLGLLPLAILLALIWPVSMPIMLCVGILVLMPPSSILPSMIAKTKADSKSVAYVNTFTGAANMVYLFLILGAVLFAVARLIS